MKKGFTLIELLAVIVILSIIAAIATPIVLKIIDNTKQSSKGITVENYLRAVENSYADAIFKKINVSDGNYLIMDDSNLCKGTISGNTCTGIKLKVSINGAGPNTGNIIVSNGKIKAYYITVDGKTFKLSPCVLSDTNNNDIGDIGEKFTCNTESFYIYDNTGDDYKLLSEYNLNVGQNKVTSDKEGLQSVNAKGMYSGGTSPYPGSISFSNSAGWATNTDIDIQNYDGPVKTAINNYRTTLTNMGVVLKDIRLITTLELTKLGCDIESWDCKTSAIHSWVYSTSYWTGISSGNNFMQYVFSTGNMDEGLYNSSSSIGVRPVIIISKSKI